MRVLSRLEARPLQRREQWRRLVVVEWPEGALKRPVLQRRYRHRRSRGILEHSERRKGRRSARMARLGRDDRRRDCSRASEGGREGDRGPAEGAVGRSPGPAGYPNGCELPKNDILECGMMSLEEGLMVNAVDDEWQG